MNGEARGAPELSPEQQVELLRLTRATLDHYLQAGHATPSATAESGTTADPVLSQPAGVFVTLWLEAGGGWTLRGCIGRFECDAPLYQAVQRMAVCAATRDPRFPPLSLTELPHLRIEISVLSPLEPVTDLCQVVIGRHGLMIEGYGEGLSRRGLLLPQVPLGRGWSAADFLTALCWKADLPADCWPGRAGLWRFTTTTFSETDCVLPRISADRH